MADTASSKQSRPQLSSPLGGSLLFAALISAGILLLIPLTQYFKPDPFDQLRDIDNAAIPPPPELTPEPPPPPDTREQEPEPELQEQREPPDLAQLELALNPSLGAGIGVGTDIGKFLQDSQNIEDFVFSISDVDERPYPIQTVDPIKPRELQVMGIKGRVLIQAVITKTGTVRDAFVERSEEPRFNQAALQAFRKWRFEPAKKGGEPVNVRVRIPIQM